MAFYYQFVVPNRSFIELGRRLPIEQALTAHYSEYVSMQWEKLCRDAVTGNLVNGVVYGKAKRWWGSVLNEDKKPEQVEFDVMAESLDKKSLLVGECKWTTGENDKQLTAALLRKKLICCRLLRTTPSFRCCSLRTLRKMMLGMQCCRRCC